MGGTSLHCLKQSPAILPAKFARRQVIQIQPQRPETMSEEFSIVLIGDFNPKIYQPLWFANQQLVRESEAEAATVELVHSDFTSFSTDWFALQVTRERFTATVKAAAYRRHLLDLVFGTFSKLSHTPIAQLGINAATRLRFRSTQDWNAFGHFLVPKAHWATILKTPGTRSVTIEGMRTDDFLGRINVIAEPVQETPDQALIRINDHYDRPFDATGDNASYFLGILEKCYDDSLSRAKAMTDSLLEIFLKQSAFDDGLAE